MNFLLNVGVTPIPFLAPVAYYGVFFTFFFFCRASLRAFLPSCVSSFFFVANAAFRCVTSCLALFFSLLFSFFFLLYPRLILHFSASHVLRRIYLPFVSSLMRHASVFHSCAPSMFLPTEHASHCSISVATIRASCCCCSRQEFPFFCKLYEVTIASWRLFFLAFGLRFVFVSFAYVAFVPM